MEVEVALGWLRLSGLRVGPGQSRAGRGAGLAWCGFEPGPGLGFGFILGRGLRNGSWARVRAWVGFNFEWLNSN